MDILIEPFTYEYMSKAILASAFIGAICAFMSCFLMLKGWSLIGDALSHSVVPGIVVSSLLGFPYAIGAFFTGLLATLSMAWIKHTTFIKQDAIIGLVFTTFFAAGMFMVSLSPIPFNINSILYGNILAISDTDMIQVFTICFISFIVMLLIWKNLLLVFFDENHAYTVSLSPQLYKIVFFITLSASTVAAFQAVGTVLVIAMVITPGATAYLLSDKFKNIILIATITGCLTSAFGAYISYFLDGATGGLIVLFQTIVFVLVLLFSPKHGLFKKISVQDD